jgi:hypothetical protein
MQPVDEILGENVPAAQTERPLNREGHHNDTAQVKREHHRTALLQQLEPRQGFSRFHGGRRTR